jgi:hypothetical protein
MGFSLQCIFFSRHAVSLCQSYPLRPTQWELQIWVQAHLQDFLPQVRKCPGWYDHGSSCTGLLGLMITQLCQDFFFKSDKQMPFKARLSVVMLKNSWGVDNLYGLGQRSSLLFIDVTRQPGSTAQPNQIHKSILAAAQAKLRLSLRLL